MLSGARGEFERDFSYGVIRQHAAALARPVLAPEPVRRDLPEVGASHQLEALHGLYWLVVNLATEAPALLAVDDVRWWDGASLRFLLYLRRRLKGLPVLLLLAARLGEWGTEERRASPSSTLSSQTVAELGAAYTFTILWVSAFGTP